MLSVGARAAVDGAAEAAARLEGESVARRIADAGQVLEARERQPPTIPALAPSMVQATSVSSGPTACRAPVLPLTWSIAVKLPTPVAVAAAQVDGDRTAGM